MPCGGSKCSSQSRVGQQFGRKTLPLHWSSLHWRFITDRICLVVGISYTKPMPTVDCTLYRVGTHSRTPTRVAHSYNMCQI